jgi:hypothetical protein
MLSTWYFWQQRFDALVATPDSPWFDDPANKGKPRDAGRRDPRRGTAGARLD